MKDWISGFLVCFLLFALLPGVAKEAGDHPGGSRDCYVPSPTQI